MTTPSGIVAVVVLVVAFGACGSSASHATGSKASEKSTSSAAPSVRTLDVVLGDHGLTFSPRSIAAGRFRVSFHDRRANRPPGQKVVLQFAPSGPLIVQVEVPAATQRTADLLRNMIAWVAIDGVRHAFGGEDSLTISTSPQFPTPAT